MLDLLVFAGAFALCHLLRFEFYVPRPAEALLQMFYVVPVQLAALWAVGGRKFVWRYVGMTEVRAFVGAALISALLLVLLSIALAHGSGPAAVPLSIIIMDTCFAFGGALLLRVARRAMHERGARSALVGASGRRPILLIGAGQAGMLVARELRARAGAGLEVKGFVDDDPRKQGMRIQGIDVLGTTEDVPRLVPQLGVDHVVITIGKTSREEMARILRACEAARVPVRIMPALSEIILGEVQVSSFREIRIEDLLGRDSVQLDEEMIERRLTGKRIMVTGAGGSIGSELVRQIARFRPATLLLVERAESSLFQIHSELEGAAGRARSAAVPLLADINDGERMRAIFEEHRPQVVLHAAAHKHVPMAEANAAEVVRNNALATNLVGELAGEYGAEAFVLISTDKAVNPVSVMGASKRVAELAVQDLNRRFRATSYLAVRFGNVIGSAGSVIPIFQEQIRRGGPVTVTDERMERYFMTIAEAARLVLQAGSMGRGGEIFTLKMGAPIRIHDLAREMIVRSGLEPGRDIEIEITGARPGEKLFEELFQGGESHDPTRHPRILVGKIPAYPPEKVSAALARLERLVRRGDDRPLRLCLNDLLPEARLEVEPERETHTGRLAPAATPAAQANFGGTVEGSPSEAQVSVTG